MCMFMYVYTITAEQTLTGSQVPIPNKDITGQIDTVYCQNPVLEAAKLNSEQHLCVLTSDLQALPSWSVRLESEGKNTWT